MTTFNDMIQKLRHEANKEKIQDAIDNEKWKQLQNQIESKDPFFGSGYSET